MGTDGTVPTRRMRRHTNWSVILLRGFPHLLHTRTLRRALLDLVLSGGADSMTELAASVGCSRSTMSRLFTGRGAGLPILLRTLETLDLRFEEVCWPLEGELLRRVMAGAVKRGGVVEVITDPLSLPGTEHIRPRAPEALPSADRRMLASG